MFSFITQHRLGLIITAMSLLLICSNGYWAFQVLDREVTLGYKRAVIYQCKNSHLKFQEIIDASLEYDFNSLSIDEMLKIFPNSFRKSPYIGPWTEKWGTEFVVVGQHELWFKNDKFSIFRANRNCMPEGPGP